MNTILDKFSKFGIIPVVVLEDVKDAEPLGKALMEGGLACGGSWMVKKELIKSGNFKKITELTAEASSIVKGIRG